MSCCGADLDDLCAFKTYKTVKVRHKWLGCVYYGVTTLIVAYTVGYCIVYQKGWREPIDVSGNVRSSIQAASTLPPVTTLKYCTQSGVAPTTFPQRECVYPDYASGHLSQSPGGDAGAMLVGTRLSTTMQRPHACPPDVYDCAPWEDASNKSSVFVGGVEACTVMVQHIVSKTTEQTYKAEVIDTMDENRPVAMLRGPGPTGTLEFPVQKVAGVPGDIFNISSLLYVAGVASLDEPSFDNANSSIRYDGMTIKIRVVYSGHDDLPTASGLKATTAYEYRVSVNRLEAKRTFADSDVFINGSDARALRDLHGIEILFSQDGDLTVFSVSALMVSVLSGLAYLFVAKMAADYFLLYCAPRRSDYRLFVQMTTPDFEPDTDGERKVLERVLKRKRRKNEFHMGDAESGGAMRPSEATLGADPRLEPLAATPAGLVEVAGADEAENAPYVNVKTAQQQQCSVQ